MLSNLAGSLGLFLLGMWLMTEGLKLAGGRALESLLGKWTSSRVRGLAAGVLITALVQSSSAVTVATIGFVNAGLMTFQRALWVVFGSNVGTSFTAWIITLFGFSLKIDAFTFPLVGIGAALRIFGPNERLKALGMALAGFGLLFMGIQALQENFGDHAHNINIEGLLAGSSFQTLWALAIGFLLTLLTQSSSAAIAIILTAVASGVVGVQAAAAAVIGANIGTTSTALIATLGATAQAKRLALAHVGFNVLTALVALLSLPLFWLLVEKIAVIMGTEGNNTLMLAIFHTCFNLLGVLLMWPIEPRLSRRLLRLFEVPRAEQRATYLDANVATVPDLAIRAMARELDDIGVAFSNITWPDGEEQGASPEYLASLRERLTPVNDFIGLALKSGLTEKQGELLTAGLSVSHHLHNAAQTCIEALHQYQSISKPPREVPRQLRHWLRLANEFAYLVAHSDTELQEAEFETLLEKYRTLKKQLLSAAVGERLDIQAVDTSLLVASLSRRFVEQMRQAREAFAVLKPLVDESAATVKSEVTVDTSAVEPETGDTPDTGMDAPATENPQDVVRNTS